MPKEYLFCKSNFFSMTYDKHIEYEIYTKSFDEADLLAQIMQKINQTENTYAYDKINN